MWTLLTIPWFRPEPIRLFPLPESGWLPDALYVHPFGMLVLMAVLVGALVTDRKARADGLQPRMVGELAGYIMVGGFVFGHVLDAVFYHWEEVVARPFLLLELHNGLSSFGGFVGAAMGATIWVYSRKRSFLAFADPIAFSFPFGWTLGRIGCFLAHDHPGRVSDFALAVDDYVVRGTSAVREPRHDLGLYEALYSVGIALLFLGLGRKRRRRGFYLAILPILYAPIRFGLDFLRATDVYGADPRFFGLTPGHYGALVLFLGGAAVAWRVWREPEAFVGPDARYARPRALKLALISAAALGRAIEEGAKVVAYEGVPGIAVTDVRDRDIEDPATWSATSEADDPVLRAWIVRREQLEAGDATPLLEGIARVIARKKSALDVIVIEGGDVPAVSAQVMEVLGAAVFTFDEDVPLVVIDRGDGALAAAVLGEPVGGPVA